MARRKAQFFSLTSIFNFQEQKWDVSHNLRGRDLILNPQCLIPPGFREIHVLLGTRFEGPGVETLEKC